MTENQLLFRACRCVIGKLMEKGSSSVAIYDGTKLVTISWYDVLSKLEEKLDKGGIENADSD